MTLLLKIFFVVLICSNFVTPWPFKVNKIRGVNLGSWLVLEKWITPEPFKGTPDWVNDEFKLCQHLGYEEARKRLTNHRNTWVTEADIISLKNSGINFLRIPIGYWALEIFHPEPWVWGSWDYVVKACQWAKKHGLEVMIDLHGAPGSQNGNDHSGQSGEIKFFDNEDNINRAVRILARIANWANAPEWSDTVKIIQLLNEPVLWTDYNGRLEKLKQFYRKAYDEIRKVNRGIVIDVHDAFINQDNWFYLRDDPHYYWIMLDKHLYQVFEPKWKDYTCEQHAQIACNYVDELKKSNDKLWTVVGEFSLATPKTCSNQRDIARQQIGVWETSGSGWFFWNFKHGQGWNEWDFMSSVQKGWINNSGNNKAYC